MRARGHSLRRQRYSLAAPVPQAHRRRAGPMKMSAKAVPTLSTRRDAAALGSCNV